jgi:hypothetical protein
MRDSIGPDLPYDLAPGVQETWVMDLDVAIHLVRTAAATFNRPNEPVCGTIELGTGKALQSKPFQFLDVSSEQHD